MRMLIFIFVLLVITLIISSCSTVSFYLEKPEDAETPVIIHLEQLDADQIIFGFGHPI